MKDKANTSIYKKQLINQFFRGNTFNFTIAIITSIGTVMINLVISWLLRKIVDSVTSSNSVESINTLTMYVVYVFVGMLAISGVEYIFLPRFIKKALVQYKSYAFDTLLGKTISSFKDENTAKYISGLSNDTNTIESGMLTKIFIVLSQVLLFIGGISMMLYYNPTLTLIAIAFSILPIIASVFTGEKIQKQEVAVSQKNESYIATLKDSLMGFSVIKSFKAERAILKSFLESLDDAETAKLKRRRISLFINTLANFAGGIAQFGVFLAGAYLAASGKNISVGMVVLFLQLMNFLISPISALPSAYAEIKASLGLIEKLAHSLEKNTREKGRNVENKVNHGLKLSNVSFSYDDKENVLKNINIEFLPGKSYAIVGASGCGKSTLLNLLMGSYHNYNGEILIDENEIREISDESLYEIISLVQQEVFIFNSSVINNITMFRQFPEEDVNKAVIGSGLNELVEEKSSNYICGENGAHLSGGERQRISIARSLLRKTPVLLADEVTASLDKKTAAHIIDTILNLKGIMRIIVTHNLEAAQLSKYDEIVALKDGNIEEKGSFEELMDKKGYFFSLYSINQ